MRLSTGRPALIVAERLRPDVALVDIDLPVLDGIAVAAAPAERLPGSAVGKLHARTLVDAVRIAERQGWL
ncbi:hypothetical protein [Streptomyces sp. NPDC127105]|uniref:hypothetical protein n=1 Tax=Streptomyces sp. NPDC127105 TaxID=3345359 RepID=UPI0036685709